MAMRRIVRNRTSKLPVSLTGQLTVPPIVDKARAKLTELKTKIKQKRPGVVVPIEQTSLIGPGNISIDHERVLPQKGVFSRIGIDYTK